MRKIILMVLMSAYAISGFMNESDNKAVETAKENERLCEVFKSKVQTYKLTMRDDALAEATLVSYTKRMTAYCGTTSAKS